MISYNQIKEAVCAQLYAAGYRVRDEKVTDSMLANGALALVTLSPAASELVQCGKQINRALTVDCAYLESNTPTRAGMYDAVAHLTFTLDFYDLTDAASEENEKMGILEMNKEVR